MHGNMKSSCMSGHCWSYSIPLRGVTTKQITSFDSFMIVTNTNKKYNSIRQCSTVEYPDDLVGIPEYELELATFLLCIKRRPVAMIPMSWLEYADRVGVSTVKLCRKRKNPLD